MEDVKIKGCFTLRLLGPDGKLKQELSSPNIITNQGYDVLIQQAFSPQTGSGALKFIAIGSVNTAPAVTDTALGYLSAVKEATLSYTDGGKNFELSTTFQAGAGTGSIVEAGVMNGSPTGELFDRSTFSGITKNANDSLQLIFAGSLS